MIPFSSPAKDACTGSSGDDMSFVILAADLVTGFCQGVNIPHLHYLFSVQYMHSAKIKSEIPPDRAVHHPATQLLGEQ